MKSYFLEAITRFSEEDIAGALDELLPSQRMPWILSKDGDDPVAYLEFHAGETEPLCIRADVSGRHYLEDDFVLDFLEVLRGKVGGRITDDGLNILRCVITPDIEDTFLAFGWNRDRKSPVPAWIPANHPAAAIIRELSGLRLGPISGHDTLAEFAPGEPNDDIVVAWEEELQTQMFIVGTAFNGHSELCVDTKGRLFNNSVVHPAFSYVGRTFAKGMAAMLSGVRMRPMLLSGQESVTLYGEEFRRGDPRIVALDDIF